MEQRRQSRAGRTDAWVDPQPLTRYLADAPPDLQRIVNKALRKDREERYQTIKDMVVDLRSLKKDLEQSGAGTADGAEATVDSGDRPIASAAGTGIRTASSAQYIFTELKRHRTGTAVLL